MSTVHLKCDPYNLVVAGVGGQGNVTTSRSIGNMLAQLGLFVTIGDTFGASQRGGSVMSHLRISAKSSWSPQIPLGKAHMIVSMEPSETIRALRDYGNPEVKVITNTRPLFPIGVNAGNLQYPAADEIESWINEMSAEAWFLDATEEALKMGNPVLGNVILAGALAGTRELPLQRDIFERTMAERFSGDALNKNLAAFDYGMRYVNGRERV
jgi:indolepyruvate ferredoxin oxidoreductase, beta subunit